MEWNESNESQKYFINGNEHKYCKRIPTHSYNDKQKLKRKRQPTCITQLKQQ